jgi:hypothetical protein
MLSTPPVAGAALRGRDVAVAGQMIVFFGSQLWTSTVTAGQSAAGLMSAIGLEPLRQWPSGVVGGNRI